MNKSTKTLFCAAGTIAALEAVNRFIYWQAGRETTAESNAMYYEWRHGDVRYTVAGEGEPLLLVHGTYPGGGMHEWDRCISALSRRYKVYALDMIGYGSSSKPEISYSAYLYVTLINDFISDIIKKETNIATAPASGAYAVLAHSFKPGNIKKILMISPHGIGTLKNMPSKYDLWIKWIIDLPIIGTAIYNAVCSMPVVKWMYSNLFFTECSDYGISDRSAVKKYYCAAHNGGENSRFVLSALLSNYLNVDIESKLKKIDIPVHVLWCGGDRLNPPENLAAIKRFNPNICSTVIDSAKLMPHVEYYKDFNKVCFKFFSR